MVTAEFLRAGDRSLANGGTQVVEADDTRAMQGGDLVDVQFEALDIVVEIDAGEVSLATHGTS